MRAVAEGCPPRLKVVGWLHDVFEDGLASLERLQRQIPLQDDEREALDLLCRPKGMPYRDYIERIATADGSAGEIARSVKEIDLGVNLSRPPHPNHPDLPKRYEAALRRLRA